MPASAQLPPPRAVSAATPVSAARPAREKLVMAKELIGLFLQEGVPIHYHYARALIAQCPQTVHGRYVRFSDVWAWWSQTPAFQPFSGGKPKAGRRGLVSRRSRAKAVRAS